VAAPLYGSAGRTVTMVMARMSGGSCSCVHPEPLASDTTGVATS